MRPRVGSAEFEDWWAVLLPDGVPDVSSYTQCYSAVALSSGFYALSLAVCCAAYEESASPGTCTSFSPVPDVGICSPDVGSVTCVAYCDAVTEAGREPPGWCSTFQDDAWRYALCRAAGSGSYYQGLCGSLYPGQAGDVDDELEDCQGSYGTWCKGYCDGPSGAGASFCDGMAQACAADYPTGDVYTGYCCASYGYGEGDCAVSDCSSDLDDDFCDYYCYYYSNGHPTSQRSPECTDRAFGECFEDAYYDWQVPYCCAMYPSAQSEYDVCDDAVQVCESGQAEGEALEWCDDYCSYAGGSVGAVVSPLWCELLPFDECVSGAEYYATSNPAYYAQILGECCRRYAVLADGDYTDHYNESCHNLSVCQANVTEAEDVPFCRSYCRYQEWGAADWCHVLLFGTCADRVPPDSLSIGACCSRYPYANISDGFQSLCDEPMSDCANGTGVEPEWCYNYCNGYYVGVDPDWCPRADFEMCLKAGFVTGFCCGYYQAPDAEVYVDVCGGNITACEDEDEEDPDWCTLYCDYSQAFGSLSTWCERAYFESCISDEAGGGELGVGACCGLWSGASVYDVWEDECSQVVDCPGYDYDEDAWCMAYCGEVRRDRPDWCYSGYAANALDSCIDDAEDEEEVAYCCTDEEYESFQDESKYYQEECEIPLDDCDDDPETPFCEAYCDGLLTVYPYGRVGRWCSGYDGCVSDSSTSPWAVAFCCGATDYWSQNCTNKEAACNESIDSDPGWCAEYCEGVEDDERTLTWCSEWLDTSDEDLEECLADWDWDGDPLDPELAECCQEYPEAILDGRPVCTIAIQTCANLLAGNLTGVDEDLVEACSDYCDGGEFNPGWCLAFWKGGGEADQQFRQCSGGTFGDNWKLSGECCSGSEAAVCVTALKFCKAALDDKSTNNSFLDDNRKGMKDACEAYCDKQSKGSKPDWCPSGLSAAVIAAIVIAAVVVIAVIVTIVMVAKGKCPWQSESSQSEEISDT